MSNFFDISLLRFFCGKGGIDIASLVFPFTRRGAPCFASFAEREGFEPPVQLPVHRISSAARSTTPAPFLVRFASANVRINFLITTFSLNILHFFH